MSPRSLSNKELLSRVKSLVRREREITLEILEHLGEIERRRLHLELGYGSMFDYCTRGLGYSSSGAGRRVQVARCLRRFPEIAEHLRRNEVNLSTIAAIAGILSDENKSELLGRIRNKFCPEVELIAASYRPPARVRDRIKPVVVPVSTPKVDRGAGQESHLDIRSLPIGSAVDKKSDKSESAPVKTEQKYLVQFCASRELKQKLERVRSLLSSRHPNGVSLEVIFEAAVNTFLEKHDPERRVARRDRAKSVQKKAPRKPRVTGHGRYISKVVRDRVFARDRARCTYKGREGRRCGATHNLQVDHVRPFARGGSNVSSNLRLLCAAHNKLAAEKTYGNAALRFRKRE